MRLATAVWIAIFAMATESAARADQAEMADKPAETLTFRGEWTQFLSAPLAGAEDRQLRYGGRVDGFVTVDAERLGLWDGLSFQAHGEFVYGQSINRVGALLLLPANTALSFPQNDAEAVDLSFSLVQKIGKARLQAGKINLLEQSTAIPIVGGGGKDGFQHIGLASPPALLASPKVFGAILTIPTSRLLLGLGLWTPEDWTEKYVPEGLFDSGVNAMFVATLPARIGGERGWHSLSLFLTSRQSRVGESFPDLTPPPGLEGVTAPDAGGTVIKYAGQQFFWHDPANPRRNLGLFGHLALSSGTPDILDWSMTFGVAGTGPIRSRPSDRFGVGYFRFSTSRRVETALEDLLPVRDEQGVEAYYTAQIGPIMRLSANVQLVQPVLVSAPTAAYFGLRAKADF